MQLPVAKTKDIPVRKPESKPFALPVAKSMEPRENSEHVLMLSLYGLNKLPPNDPRQVRAMKISSKYPGCLCTGRQGKLSAH